MPYRGVPSTRGSREGERASNIPALQPRRLQPGKEPVRFYRFRGSTVCGELLKINGSSKGKNILDFRIGFCFTWFFRRIFENVVNRPLISHNAFSIFKVVCGEVQRKYRLCSDRGHPPPQGTLFIYPLSLFCTISCYEEKQERVS